MAAKSSNTGDFEELSLTGSQVGTSVSSTSQRPGSAKLSNRSTSASRSRDTTSNLHNSVTSKAKGKGPSSTNRQVDVSSARSSARSAKSRQQPSAGGNSSRDDFLALFESNSSANSNKQSTAHKSSKTAWGSTVDTPRSGASGDHISQAASSKHSHSVFQPLSARSTSTVASETRSQKNNVGSKSSARSISTKNKPIVQGSAVKQNANESWGARPCNGDISSRLSHQHGGNEFMLDSEQDSLTQKATKLNSIANNMTMHAFSGAAPKTPLLGMENSYQNIKPKTPVNQQVRQSPNQVGRNIAEDYVKHCNMEATKIQRWFRRHLKRRKSAEAAMKRMLDAKWHEKEDEMARERNQVDKRQRSREDKAREARQQAIQELQRKREQKRDEVKRKAEEEITFLQASGKLSKTPAHKSNVKSQGKAAGKNASGGNRSKNAPLHHNSGRDEDQSRGRASGPSADSEQAKKNFSPPSSEPQLSSRVHSSSIASDRGSDTLALSTNKNQNQDIATGGRSASPPPSHVTSSAAEKSTLDDLMATLQKLEEEEKFPSARKEKTHDKNEKPLGWLDELERSDGSSDGQAPHQLSADKLNQLQHDASKPDNVTKSGLLTDEKLRSIMTYLDEVETAERLSEMDQELSRGNDLLERPALLVPSVDELAQLEQDTAAVGELTQQMLLQKMELEERKRSASMLQKALNQQRELTVRHAKETEREMTKRLEVQKEEYEQTIKRHLGFIDQLIDDKKHLSEKCEDLVKELKLVDKKSQDQLKSVLDKHQMEITKLKEVHAAAEKLRREKWIDEKTKKIKEMTVKGLEPEIQRLIAKHKGEIKKIKSLHEAELLASDERAGGRYIKMTEELRDQLAQEKEMACSRERELARQTYEKQMQQEEEAYQQQRRRLFSEVQEEKERLNQQASRQRMELDRLQRQLESSHATTSSTLRVEYEKAREEQEKRHQVEVNQLKEQLSAEKAAWEENYMKKQETWALGKERELREQVRRDRDKEIELVIQQLEEDNRGAREECERVAENRIKRIRDKYEGEIGEMERTERQTTTKYNQIKAQHAELEGEYERLKVTMKQKDKEVEEVKKLLDKLNEERERVSDVIRQEFADRLVATEEESKRVKNNMSELKARHRVELERAKEEVEAAQKNKEEEMEEVHKRVKQAIVKKEEVVTQLKQQHQAALKRADHLEGLLEQQRKQLLSRK